MDKESVRRIPFLGLIGTSLPAAIAVAGLITAFPALITTGVGYMAGRYGSEPSPGVMAKDLEIEQLRRLRDDLEFLSRKSRYEERSRGGAGKEIRL